MPFCPFARLSEREEVTHGQRGTLLLCFLRSPLPQIMYPCPRPSIFFCRPVRGRVSHRIRNQKNLKNIQKIVLFGSSCPLATILPPTELWPQPAADIHKKNTTKVAKLGPFDIFFCFKTVWSLHKHPERSLYGCKFLHRRLSGHNFRLGAF